MNKLLTAKDVSIILRLDYEKVLLLFRDPINPIPAFKLRGRYRVSECDLQKWITDSTSSFREAI